MLVAETKVPLIAQVLQESKVDYLPVVSCQKEVSISLHFT